MKNDARRSEAFVLGGDVRHRERIHRDAVGHQRRLERLHRRVAVRLQHELDAVRRLGRDDRQPAMLAERHVVLLREAEHVGIELSAFSWSSTKIDVNTILMPVSPVRRCSGGAIAGSHPRSASG